MSIILSARHFPCLTQRTIRVRHLAKVLIVPIEAAVSGYTIALLDAFKLTFLCEPRTYLEVGGNGHIEMGLKYLRNNHYSATAATRPPADQCQVGHLLPNF